MSLAASSPRHLALPTFANGHKVSTRLPKGRRRTLLPEVLSEPSPPFATHRHPAAVTPPLRWIRAYEEEDWDFYKKLRDGRPSSDPKRLALLSGARGHYFNQDDSGGGGDGISILAPTQELVDEANKSGDYNDCSYVLLYRADGRRTVFGGDSHNDTWNHILNTYESEVSNVDLLIAPHHGRDSGRSYEFLDVLQPKLTFFGNAPSEHLAYGAWDRRDLPIVTNNQANCMVVDISPNEMKFYATHETYARARNPWTYYDYDAKAWYVHDI